MTTKPTEKTQDITRSYWELVTRDYIQNPLAMAGTFVIFIVIFVAVFCPFLANQRPLYIETAFPNDYDNALYISLEQITILASEELETPEEQKEAETLVFQQFKEVTPYLEGDDLTLLVQIENSFRQSTPSSGNFNSEALWQALDDLDPLFEANLSPVKRYPAIRSLTTPEVVALLLFLTLSCACTIRLLYRRLPRLFLMALILAIVGTVVWKHYYPTIHDTRPYRKMIEVDGFSNTGKVIRPLVPFGENENVITEARQAPTWILDKENWSDGQHWHWLGTDTNGRDVLARMIYGARVSMLVGIVAVSIYTIIGVIVGAVAGFFGGWIDIAFSRLIEIVICFPPLILILSVQAFLAPSLLNIILALAALWWTGVARLQRGEFLRLVNLDYVQAVRALGGGNLRIIFIHILPNALGPILVLVSFGIAGSILVESSLSFLGFGVPQPMASWGDLLNNGRNAIRENWWLTVFPGMAIFLTVTCFNLVGEGIRDALDPMKSD
jgi:peptide/nickel transport system permease protein